jgi:hypothetical protein
VEGLGEGEVQLVCTSRGWFPEPEVHWEGIWGEKLMSFSENHVPGEDGLFYVEDTLMVRNDSVETISCFIYSHGLRETQEATIALSGQCFGSGTTDLRGSRGCSAATLLFL